MESLDNTAWDIFIAGTGFPQSLLALALSRSDKKILHVDRNDYYGGEEAALSLSEAEAWAARYSAAPKDGSAVISHASITRLDAKEASEGVKLLSPRTYSLALAPHLLYARSPLVPALVSSHTHNQLEFQAVGSWFLASKNSDDSASPLTLTRVPGGREDVFLDKSLDLKAKRALMKFLRFVASYEEHPDTWHEHRTASLASFLRSEFGLPPQLHTLILALAMGEKPSGSTTVESALPKIARHLTSIGIFGSGFGAVLPKWGGLAEISQVACRACAVGGGVYVLGHGVTEITQKNNDSLALRLSDGSTVTTKWLVGCPGDLPTSPPRSTQAGDTQSCHRSISIISSPLTALFPPTSEGGVTPAGAVVILPSSEESNPPVHILAHTSESGECPTGQSILYASTALNTPDAFATLSEAVESLLAGVGVGEQHPPKVLCRLQYVQRAPRASASCHVAGRVLTLPNLSTDLALEDEVLQSVRAAWVELTNAEPENFLRLEARAGAADDDDDA